MVGRKYLLAPVLLVLILLSPACAELELLTDGFRGGPGPPPSGSLSVSFIDVGQGDGVLVQAGGESYLIDAGDRKSTRLNSSHANISYAVFCLKKKKKSECR